MFKKNIPRNSIWLTFFIGLIIGIAFSILYSHFTQKNNSVNPATVTTPVSFDIKDYDHTFGNPNSKNKIVVFNDLNCPYCRDYTANLYQLSQDKNFNAQIVWRHFPLNGIETESMQAAIASECADEQGHFWDFIFNLNNNQNHTTATYIDIARQLKLNTGQFTSCLNSDKFTAKVKADYYEGIMKGVIGAPASFINGEYVPGVIPVARLQELVHN